MPRRANDPSLLQAQASAGRDGERAYKVAKNQMQQQSQAAVRRAMQEAALRGAPAGAIEQLQNQVARPYDQAIRQTTQEGARYQSQLAAANARAYDYNQAILDARKLIPAQVQAAVAPIRAQNRFQLSSIRMEGANRLAEIEGQTRLMEAQMAAAAQAARIKRREDRLADREELTESELQAALIEGAMGRINRAADVIGGEVEEGQQEQSLRLVHQIAMLAQGRDVGEDAVDKARQQAVANQYGATYMAKGLAEQRGENITGSKVQLPAEDAPVVDRDTSVFGGSLFGTTNPDLSALDQPPSGPLAARSAPGAPDLAAQEAALERQLGRAAEATDIYRDTQEKYAPLNYQVPERQPLSQYGTLSEEQVAGLPRYARSLVTSAPEPFTDQSSIQRLLYGAPSFAEVVDPTTGQQVTSSEPDVSPFAGDIKREAMQLAANRLVKQGRYDLNLPAIQNAIMGSPETLFDIQQQQYGQPTTTNISERIAAGDEIGGRAREQQRIGDEQAQGEMEKDIFELGRFVYDDTIGIPIDRVHDLVTDLNSEFYKDVADVQAWLDENAGAEGFDLDLAMDELGITDPERRRMIEARYG